MDEMTEYEMGPQPIAEILAKKNLRPHDLVAASTQQLTHKMVSRACKGRRLTHRVQVKVQTALNTLTGEHYKLSDLFTY